MNANRLYQILLLPSREVAARHLALAEASAWVRTYHHALGESRTRAVIAEEDEQELHASDKPRTRAA
jgi:hypothetical protein